MNGQQEKEIFDMINTKPAEIKADLFKAIQKPEDLYIDQAILSESGSYLTYQELDPVFKLTLLGKLYCYFLYPPYCLCEYYKKKCECRQKRKEALLSLSLKTYQMVFETIQDTKTVNYEDPDIKQMLHFTITTLGLTHEQAIRTLEDNKQISDEDMLKQAQLLTGIKDHEEYLHLQESIHPDSQGWLEELNKVTSNPESYFTIAIGVGRSFISQIYSMETTWLMSSGGRRGHLSLNRIVQNVLSNRSLELFNGYKYSKIRITHAFYQYRSILHLILGYLASKQGFGNDSEVEISTSTFITAHEIQKKLLKYSKGTFTPRETLNLFTKSNLVLVPDSSLFSTPSKQGNNEINMILNREGFPHININENLQKSWHA